MILKMGGTILKKGVMKKCWPMASFWLDPTLHKSVQKQVSAANDYKYIDKKLPSNITFVNDGKKDQ